MAIMVKTSLSSKLYSTSSSFECISVEVLSSLLVSCIYLPPNHGDCHISALMHFIKNLPSSHTHLIIGDFNIDWSPLLMILSVI